MCQQDVDPQPHSALGHTGQGDYHSDLHVRTLDVLPHAHTEGMVQAAQRVGIERQKNFNGLNERSKYSCLSLNLLTKICEKIAISRCAGLEAANPN